MKKIFSSIILGIFLISLISAFPICVDKNLPSAPLNLEVTSSGTNIILNWEFATDKPNCSGVDYYNVARDGNIIAEHIIALIYTDINVPYGTYSYSVWAVDKVGHNSGPAIKNDVVLSEPTGGGSTHVEGGSGRRSYVCYEEWQCSDWGSCVNEIQTRTCQDLAECGTTNLKPATTRACSIEETGEGKETINLSPEETGEETIPPENQTGFSRITGAVTGALGNFGWLIIIIFILGIIGLSISVRLIRKRRLKKI